MLFWRNGPVEDAAALALQHKRDFYIIGRFIRGIRLAGMQTADEVES